MIYVAYEVQKINVQEGFSNPGGLKVLYFVMKLGNAINSIYNSHQFTPVRRAAMEMNKVAQILMKDTNEWKDTTWDGIEVRVYNSEKIKEGGPAFVYIHGGGWISGSAAIYHNVVTKLFQELQIFTVSIDYKMAPENKYPGPENDCEAAIVYLMKNAKTFKIDPTKIIVGGDSAGGHLALQVAHRFMDRSDNLPSLRAIVPIYPVVQPYVLSGPSYQANQNESILPSDHMSKYWSLYLTGSIEWYKVFENGHQTECSVLKELKESNILDYNFPDEFNYKKNIQGFLDTNCVYNKDFWQKYGEILQDEDFSILLRDFQGYPPTHLITMQYDVLRDDGLLLLKRLKKDGVDVTHYHEPNGMHGLINMIDHFDENRKLIKAIVQFVKKYY